MQIPNMEGSAGLHGEDTDMAAPHPRAVLKADTFLCTTRGRCVIFYSGVFTGPSRTQCTRYKKESSRPLLYRYIQHVPRQMANSTVASDLKMELCRGWSHKSPAQAHLRIQTRTQDTEGTPFVSVSQCSGLTACGMNCVCLNSAQMQARMQSPKHLGSCRTHCLLGLEETLILWGHVRWWDHTCFK